MNMGVEKENIGNGKWDYVVYIIRNSVYPKNPNGYTTGGNNAYLLGHKVDSYSMQCAGNSSNPTHIIRHEYAHMLLGGNNFHTCGGGWSSSHNYWIPQTGGWALLGLYGSSLMCWNAWDRYRLGWKALGNTYDISARKSDGITEVNGDIDCCDDGIYVLRDFVTTGDALRIKLPYIDEEREYPEWIWLENHQGTSNNNVEFDQWQYQDAGCVENLEPGLMAYIQINSDIRVSNNQSSVFNQFADYLNPLTANGFWDRSFLTDSVNNGCVSYAMIRPFIRVGENPLTGCGDQSFYSIDLDNDDCLYSDPYDKRKQDQINNWTEKEDNIYHKNLFQLGHSSHSFNLNGNKKIGIGTNPSSAPLINMVGQKTQYTNAKNLRKTYLNGISIEILEQCANGDIKVRVRFDDVDVENDVRWCSDSIVLNNIPTISGYSLNVKEGKTILLDQGLNATRMTDPIVFNGQKIFASPTTFTVQPDVRIHLDSAARIVLDNSSKLRFREKSACIIEDMGNIEVKSGTILQLDDCSSLVINGMGKLIVRSGAELRLSNTASLAFQNATQNLIVEQGVNIPDGFANPLDLLTNTVSNVTVTDNMIWNEMNLKVNGQIVVETGATLNITSSLLKFADEDSRIIIKRGGKLIIDGSTLKSANSCAGKWQGIEVWGNRNQHQYQVNGEYLQGYLEMKNGATIENAVCAVELWRPGYRDYTGGIIHATDAVFRNNTKAVHALSYYNYSNITTNKTVYNGWFKNCSFVIDEDYTGGEIFYRHVEMSFVNGISFKGCDFYVDRNVGRVSQDCIGISAHNAGFTVTSYCDNNFNTCSDDDLKRGSFTGFKTAILSANQANNTYTFNVNKNVFNKNDCAIFAKNIHFATIVNNDFNIGCSSDCNYGVYTDEVSGFCIEENTFRPTADSCTAYGIGIVNSGSVNNVYRNVFGELTCGNIALGINHNVFGSESNFLGLTYLCNDNQHNTIDFCVLKDNGTGGVGSKQGSAASPAGNTFSGSLYHFYNDGDYLIDYYHNANASGEIPNTSKLYRVNPVSTANTNNCHSHYGHGGVVRSAVEKNALADAYQAANNTYTVLENLYESRIDGGSTATSVSEINTASSGDMWQLRSKLLGNSPYVSNEVLTKTVDRDDVFSKSVLFEILSANPDELKRDTLINYIESKGDRLPDYMIETLRQMASGTTARTALTSQMARYAHEKNMAAGDIVRSNLNDTMADPDELRLWLGNLNDISADRFAIASYIQEGDFSSAFALANTLPDVYGLQGNDLADHYDYLRLLNLYQTLHNSDRTVFEMTDDERNMVNDIAERGTGTSKSMATAIVVEIDGYVESYVCPDMPGERGRGWNTHAGIPVENDDFSVSVSPIPATTWVSVDYRLPDKASKAEITLTNSLGMKVLSVELAGSEGSETLDLSGLPAGVYIMKIRTENGHELTERIVKE